MPKTIEFMFDVGSPTTYLAHRRLPAIAARTSTRHLQTRPEDLRCNYRATLHQHPPHRQCRNEQKRHRHVIQYHPAVRLEQQT